MPRYFFHVAGDDDNGTELPDDAAARQVALDTFGALIREDAVGDNADLEVTEAGGRRVVKLRFSIER